MQNSLERFEIEQDRKNRIFFTMHAQYLSKTDIKTGCVIINNRLNLNLTYSIETIKHFSYKLNAGEIESLNNTIEKRCAFFRGKCLAKIQEYSIHYSDRACQKPRINAMINAINKVCDPAGGQYFT